MQTCCPVVEFRQYTLHPGKRDVLIDLFDREFIEPQEELGMTIIGQFRDLDNPDRFVWLRGFQDMMSRARSLEAFYGGPVWKANREAANETMIDSDNVLLLRPMRPNSGFVIEKSERPALGTAGRGKSIVTATISYFDASANGGFADFFEGTLAPIITENGASILGRFVTEHSKNTFPALPVREGENVFVWFARFENEQAHTKFVAASNQSQRGRDEVSKKLQQRVRKSEVLRLSPTERSLLR